MANIISLEKKLKLSEEKKKALIRKRNMLAVRKTFQCAQCALKCVKCSMPLGENYSPENNRDDIKIPYRFCKECSEEYIDYIQRFKRKGSRDCYWHNKEWTNVWKTWIDHQTAAQNYLKSKEFMQLVEELKQTIAEE